MLKKKLTLFNSIYEKKRKNMSTLCTDVHMHVCVCA